MNLSAVSVFGIMVSSLAFFFLLWKLPQWQVRGAGLERKDQLDLEIKARGTLAQIAAGSLFLLTAYATWNSIDVSRRTLEVSQQGQLTSRFSNAAELLGTADTRNGDALPVRLGGIYSLERIARDSSRDYWPIIEILTGYVRSRAARDLRKERQDGSGVFAAGRELFNPPTDVQAVLSVLRRRSRSYRNGEEFPIDLSATDLRGTYITETNLDGAHLFATNLSDAYLTHTRLRGAMLAHANLNGAFLSGADLQDANLDDASFLGARYDTSTRWPTGFDPKAQGAVLER
jgi:hypothetical protein